MSGDELRARFDEPAPMTVGLEEELMVLDAATLDLAERAAEIVHAVGDARVRPELPASQVEFVTAPAATVPDAIAELAHGRAVLTAVAEPLGLALAGMAAHPFAATRGALTRGEHYDALAATYGSIPRSQLVCALQVHVCVRGADRALAVHDALRSYLPLVAALAANAPFHAGIDTGLASIRPAIGGLLPRQGVPPALGSWDALADGFAMAGDGNGSSWWWELRPHARFGTLEVRVPDTQATIAEAEAVAATVHALVAWLCARHDDGETLEVQETWRIEHDRWLASRHGVAGEMGERVARLLDAIEPVADEIGCARGIGAARELVAAGGGAGRMRAAAGTPPDLFGAVAAVAARFGDPAPG